MLGREYEKTKSPELLKATKIVEELGGVVEYHGADTWLSIDALEKDFAGLEAENRRQQFKLACDSQGISGERLFQLIDKFKDTSLMVVGDTIVDKYVACSAIGMSAEAPVIVLKELEQREYLGGAAIVASHVKSLGGQCHFISVLGDDDVGQFVQEKLRQSDISAIIAVDPARPTTYKTRFTVEHQKMCRVSRLDESSIPKNIEEEVIERIKATASEVQGIIVSDFGYGCVTDAVLDAILTASREHNLFLFGDVQCSSQIGSVLKFTNFDLVCPTEREARISLSNKDDNVEVISNKIIEATKCQNLLMKLGSNGLIVYADRAKKTDRQHFPALNINPVDVAGAGDSLLATMAVSMCSGGTTMQSAAIGSCVAGIAVSTFGNTPVSIEQVEEKLRGLL